MEALGSSPLLRAIRAACARMASELPQPDRWVGSSGLSSRSRLSRISAECRSSDGPPSIAGYGNGDIGRGS